MSKDNPLALFGIWVIIIGALIFGIGALVAVMTRHEYSKTLLKFGGIIMLIGLGLIALSKSK